MDRKTKPCRWATGGLDVTRLAWAPDATYAYRRKCQAPVETSPGPCIFCMENWTCADSAAVNAIVGTADIQCRVSYEPVGVTLNRITPEPALGLPALGLS